MLPPITLVFCAIDRLNELAAADALAEQLVNTVFASTLRMVSYADCTLDLQHAGIQVLDATGDKQHFTYRLLEVALNPATDESTRSPILDISRCCRCFGKGEVTSVASRTAASSLPSPKLQMQLSSVWW